MMKLLSPWDVHGPCPATLRSIAAGLGLALALAGCDPRPGFLCGASSDGDKTFQQCTGNKEVCICATNSCAKREDVGACSVANGESGYRYVDEPFADDEFAGACVDKTLITPRVEQTNLVKSCEALRLDAGIDATGSSSDSGASSGGQP